MTDCVLTLISRGPRVKDADGVHRDAEPTRREVFARMGSVSRAEFFAGGQSGFRPELRFTLFADEYQGESECACDGVTYAIYRTHRPEGSDTLELYAQRKAGIGNG